MADYTKTYTLDFAQLGDTVYEACDKLEDDIDSLVTWVNDLKDNYASTSAPTSPAPSEGQLFWDTTNDKFQVYDGSAWYDLESIKSVYLYDTNASHALTVTWNENDTAARTLNLAVGGGNRTFTINENFTIGDGSAGTLTYSAASKTLTVEDTAVVSQDYSADGTPTFGTVYFYDEGGESITSDGTDMTIASGNDMDITAGADINLTATADVNVPANIGLTFGDDGEKIEGDGTDITISSSNLLNLTATTDVVIPVNIGLIFGDGAEKIESNNTDITINSGGDINLTATNDVNIPVNIGVTFGDDGEKIEGDGTDLTISSSAKLNLTATSDVIIPVNIGLIFGDGAEKIESNNTDLTINSGGDINLTATYDINVPANIGVTFGDDGEKIEGDGTDLTITSSGVLNLTATSYVSLNDDMLITEGTALRLDESLSADGTYTGFTIAGTAGATLAFGQLVYLASVDSKWELTDADAESTTKPLLGIVVVGGENNETIKLLMYGTIREDDWAWTNPGDPLYADTVTAGGMTRTKPSGSGDAPRIVAHALDSNSVFFHPDNYYEVV